MRRGIGIAVLVLLALAGFYVAWPAWSARQIRNAIEANDPGALERKIDFVRVRERAKPLIAAEVDRSLDKLKREAGPIGAAIAGQLKEGIGGKLAEAAIDSVLTPANVVRMVRQGKDLRRVIREVTGKTKGGGPAGSKAEEPATDNGGKPRRLGLENVKGYRLTGPLSLAVDVAHDPKATEPDVTAELAFTDFDWKVVGLVPRL